MYRIALFVHPMLVRGLRKKVSSKYEYINRSTNAATAAWVQQLQQLQQPE
jgi:hypothetical protein